ncbi:MAG: hypothetical protein AB7T19_15110 [Planctomycetota bacterium]
MNKALMTALAGIVAGSLSAQVIVDPCGPGVFGTPGPNADLGNLNWDTTTNGLGFNITEVAQVFLVANPAGGYWGSATVKKSTGTDFDAITFSWAGPGNQPVANADANSLNGTADEFQMSLSTDGLITVLDAGAGNPNTGGANRPFLASRATPSGPFTFVATISGAFPSAAGYYDPQLGRYDLDQNGTVDDVLYWAAPSGGIDCGILNRATGAISATRTAIPALSVAGFQFCHSPTPQYDATGVSHALIFSVFASATGSDSYYYPGRNSADYPGATLAGLQPYAMFDDGTNWDANPALVRGSAYYARATGGYTDPLLVEFFSMSGMSVSASAGGTGTIYGALPLGQSTSILTGAINIGAPVPSPLPVSAFGLNGFGNLCIAPFASVGTGSTTGDFAVNLTFPAGFPAGALPMQGVMLNVLTQEVYLSNVAYLELR